MAFEDRTYVVLPIGALSAVTFSQVIDSQGKSRKNNDESEVIIEYKGNEPDCLTGCTKVTYFSRDYHTVSEIKQVTAITGATGWAASGDTI